MKKNILYISPNFNLACGVSKNIFTLLTSKELQKEFNLHFITNGGDALFKLDKAGVNYYLMNFKTNKSFHFDLYRNLKQLKNYCKENQVDLIHSHHRYPEFLANRIKKSMEIRTIMTAHNFVAGFKSFSYKSDCIIAISHSVKKHIVDNFVVTPEKIKVLYNCIEPDYSMTNDIITIKKKLDIPKENFVIFYGGRIVSEKGIETLTDSFRLLFKGNENISLLVVGASNSLVELDQFNLRKKNIIIISAKENLTEYYSIADVIVLPSVREPLGYTMLEAGLYKIPFIGSNNGGIAEFIEKSVHGYLFEPGNVTELAEKIMYVIQNPDEVKLTANRLHEKVMEECNYDSYFNKLIGIYSNLLNEK